MQTQERRRTTRYGFQADVDVEWGSEVMRGMVTDISLGGMFIATASPLWVGATFTARVFLGEPLRLDAIVRRVVPQRGMGVEFVDVDAAGRARLEELVARLTAS